ncbi:preprotein translocase subunit SecG [Hydrogenophaga sp.]|uniref:preprotein translocase subunit SecG n=1 Tax=Hydrogenophaga sp. TaxID=1904254 RepID=UPI00272F0618|nr:preprotein translocase subunit SecG [Hydrogenophaga sp.]MDP1684696.1 preprotein translocase subunit SecG [Hydrogenophaga sp.]
MNVVLTLLLAVQILSALTMIGLILMQHGKGADAGAAFGGGGAGSASLFGASGGANFMSRSTAVLAAVFLGCTLGLAYFGNLRTAAPSSGSVLEGVVTPAQPADASQQIPGTAPANGVVPAPAAATPAPTGAAQIPAK